MEDYVEDRKDAYAALIYALRQYKRAQEREQAERIASNEITSVSGALYGQVTANRWEPVSQFWSLVLSSAWKAPHCCLYANVGFLSVAHWYSPF